VGAKIVAAYPSETG